MRSEIGKLSLDSLFEELGIEWKDIPEDVIDKTPALYSNFQEGDDE